MTNTVTPVWTDNLITIIGDQVITLGSSISATWALGGSPSKIMGVLFVALGRGGTAVLSQPVGIEVIRMLNAGAVNHPNGGTRSRQSTTVAASLNTTVATTSNSGQKILTVSSGVGAVAGNLICIQDSGGGVTRLEWAKISKVSGATITLVDNLQFTHTSGQADTVRNAADVFEPIPILGGASYRMTIDYGAAGGGTGDSITVRAIGQTYDSDLVS